MRRVIAAIMIILILSIQCFAHQGKTDSAGGHTDHSTGEYHYHHGYPAHDHYDMDGDGVRDCPYNFIDKTGSNSGSSPGGLSSSPKHETNKTEKQETPSKKAEEKTENTFWNVLGPILEIGFWAGVIYLIYYFASRSSKNQN